MKDYTLEELLKIDNPCILFSNNEIESKTEFRVLALKWHPDKNRVDTNEVFAHIQDLYNKALKLIEQGKWEIPGLLQLYSTDGTRYNIRYKVKHSFELGTVYISDTIICYIVDKEYETLFNNAKTRINSLKYADKEMEKQIGRCLPKIVKDFKSVEGKYVMVVEKTEDLLLLRDVVNHYKKTSFPKEWDKHVAWIMSRLHNLTCYLEHVGLTHNAISVDTVYITVKFHGVTVLGGWWYSIPKREKMKGIPADLYDLIPPDILASKLANKRTDMELIRAVGRELLGDRIGNRLLSMKVAPEPMIRWLKNVSCGNAVKDFKTWKEEVLVKSFGPGKFIKLELTSEELYERV